MSPHTSVPTTTPQALPHFSEQPLPESSYGHHRLAMVDTAEPTASSAEGPVNIARHALATVLRYWGYRPEMWRIIGFTTSANNPFLVASSAAVMAADAHLIVEVMQTPVVVRRQLLSLAERHTMVRHASPRSWSVPTDPRTRWCPSSR